MDVVRGADGSCDEGALLEELRRRRPGEVQRGLSLYGPHRDDLRFLELPVGPPEAIRPGQGCAVDGSAPLPSEGRDLRLYGSQGEQRAAVLALLLAEREVAAARGAGIGTLFLDDVMSELDDARRRRLVELLSHGGQAIVTTTNRHYFTEEELARAVVVELPLAGERCADESPDGESQDGERPEADGEEPS
jgi:DNA replication and repair protein RecF